MEREHRSLLTLFAAQTWPAHGEARLDADAAQHARVRRVGIGDDIRLLDGAGRIGYGSITALAKNHVDVRVSDTIMVPPPPPLDVVVPVADRDRMLLAAEKCVELQVTNWRPAYFARSKSVGTRGEGEKFREKVRARMRSALEQCGSAWLPSIHAETRFDAALAAVDAPRRYILDGRGDPLRGRSDAEAVGLAIGPEGGFEAEELADAVRAGWTPSSLGAATLRFETAIIAATAVIRAAQYTKARS